MIRIEDPNLGDVDYMLLHTPQASAHTKRPLRPQKTANQAPWRGHEVQTKIAALVLANFIFQKETVAMALCLRGPFCGGEGEGGGRGVPIGSLARCFRVQGP